MKKCIVFDTSIGSLNIGDQIINESFYKEKVSALEESFIVKYPTHTPVSHFYQNTKFNRFYRYVKSCDYKFIIGTNLLSSNMFEPWPNWNVNIFNYKPYVDSILVGVGYNGEKKANFYTKTLYKRMFSKEYVHSTRDEKTKEILEELGFKAINTGCPTFWGLTKEHCSKIPTKKAKKVIFTLTDYCKDVKNDQELINILNSNYDEVMYWVQGSNDLEYFKTLKNIEKIKIIPPILERYKEELSKGEVDYVGTRLHAGIFAMQNYCRTIILIVDNRARDIKATYNIVALERENLANNLEKMINKEFDTQINIKEDKINEWKSQFKE